MDHLTNVIGGPRECLRVDNREAFERRIRTIRVQLGLNPTLRLGTETLTPHVSDGRWVVDCPCGSAGLASSEWNVGICADCGTIHPLRFPRDREAVEAELLARPSPLQRHFFPGKDCATRRGLPAGETLASIRRENEARGHRVVGEDG